ncbi:replication protein A 70 kDa DNA-binding subunit B [Tanacetum coccineum]
MAIVESSLQSEFLSGTTVTRVGSFDNNPRGFKFEHFTAFTARKFAETKLCDIIETVVSVLDAIPLNNYGKDQLRRTIILEDVQGAQLECCFFDAWCNKFAKLHDKRESMGHVVMILQLCKVMYFNEKPFVSPAMYSTKLYLNDDIQEIAAFKQRSLVNLNSSSSQMDKVLSLYDLEFKQRLEMKILAVGVASLTPIQAHIWFCIPDTYCSLMEHGIPLHVYGTDIITVGQGCCEKRGMELMKKVANPRCLSYSIRTPFCIQLQTLEREQLVHGHLKTTSELSTKKKHSIQK